MASQGLAEERLHIEYQQNLARFEEGRHPLQGWARAGVEESQTLGKGRPGQD